jgi:hypothetical protein
VLVSAIAHEHRRLAVDMPEQRHTFANIRIANTLFQISRDHA